MNTHEFYVSRCIQLAINGLGNTYPNPMVGAVLVHNHTIIGEGWHRKAGEPHAEVMAIQSVANKDLLKESVLYVSLEPCSHFGKTPPCSRLILEYNIPKVVVGCMDSNPLVAGKGIQMLRENGVKVVENVLEKQCKALNKRFFTFHDKKRPYIILKFAKSSDGFIDILRDFPTLENAKGTPISNRYTNQLVHKWRSEEQAILVGKNTILKDNSQLNVRNWKGNEPYKIVIDRNLEIPNDYALFKQQNVLIFNQIKSEISENVQYIKIDFYKEIFVQIFKQLHSMQIQSVLIEGGKNVLEQLISLQFWDEAKIISNRKINVQQGISAPKISGELLSQKHILDDEIQIIRNQFAP